MANDPRQHHTTPASYLRLFCIPDTEQVHWLDVTNGEMHRQDPKNIMRQRDYYRQPHAPPGTDEFCLEREVSRLYETHIPRWIDTLISNPRSFSQEDFLQFMHCIEFQIIRVPRAHDGAREDMRRYAEELVMDEPGLPTGRVADHFKVEINDSFRFHFMRELTLDGTYRKLFYRMIWDICRVPGASQFVTTDNPVIFLNPFFPAPLDAPLNLAGTMMFYPLTPSWCLRLRHPESEQRPQPHPVAAVSLHPIHEDHMDLRHGVPIDDDDVETVNYALGRLAKRFVAASDEGPLIKLKEELATAKEQDSAANNTSELTSGGRADASPDSP